MYVSASAALVGVFASELPRPPGAFGYRFPVACAAVRVLFRDCNISRIIMLSQTPLESSLFCRPRGALSATGGDTFGVPLRTSFKVANPVWISRHSRWVCDISFVFPFRTLINFITAPNYLVYYVTKEHKCRLTVFSVQLMGSFLRVYIMTFWMIFNQDFSNSPQWINNPVG